MLLLKKVVRLNVCLLCEIWRLWDAKPFSLIWFYPTVFERNTCLCIHDTLELESAIFLRNVGTFYYPTRRQIAKDINIDALRFLFKILNKLVLAFLKFIFFFVKHTFHILDAGVQTSD
jgi:hypothetical protein